MELELKKAQLKVQALLNRVTSTENENAELRVELHVATENVAALTQEVESLRAQLGPADAEQNQEPELPEPTVPD